jgi:hypothetical protein
MFCICFIIIIDLRFIHFCLEICQWHLNVRLKCLFTEKMFIEVCCKKCQKCNTIYVITFFYWISRVCKKKKFIYIHQNLRYYETIEQIHFMVVKIESYVWGKNCNIWSQSLIPPPPSSKTTKE